MGAVSTSSWHDFSPAMIARLVRLAVRLCSLAFMLLACQPLAAKTTPARSLVVEAPQKRAFILSDGVGAAPILYDPADHQVVIHAATDLAGDLKAVTGIAPRLLSAPMGTQAPVIVGTLGRSALVDRMVAGRRLDVRELRGAWESFVITTVEHPLPGIDRALVIVGSDRRGTAFGIYELSAAMGVSPWSYWADVPPRRRPSLYVPAGMRRFGPPSVRYRGIFINDEDWGLFPWAAKTFDPKYGNIGPKTYERVFALLLRLKANTLWPAMHKTSAAFNSDPRNAALADEYGIVMGSSHAEPMLRNNVGEWKGAAGDFNYARNLDGVRTYWEERVRTNARFESQWTLGMRGIHDSGMVGAGTTAERIGLLDRVIADQRAMLRQYTNPDLTGVQQIFIPYKEVLDLYRGGLKVPDDVTIVWPDDNFGYIRQFANDRERARKGGTGIYYHLSYLGAPYAYLWLSTTPPALVQEEMTRAYDRGARTLWIANVGDIKPAEIGTSHFLEMAWDIDRWRGRSQREFLADWAGRTFGAANSPAIGSLLDEYFRLNFERRPEHLYWKYKVNHSDVTTFTRAEIEERLRRFDRLVTATGEVAKSIPPMMSDAFFEIVEYPVRASAAANRRAFGAELYAQMIDTQPALARSAAGMAAAADAEIKALTRKFNEEVAGGKWNGIMAEEPADSQWAWFRPPPVALPIASLRNDPALFEAAIAAGSAPVAPTSFEAEAFTANKGWRLIESLGRGGGSMIASSPGATLTLRIAVPDGAPQALELGLLPLFPHDGDAALHLEVTIDAGTPIPISISREAGSPAWAEAVLDNLLRVVATPELAAGDHTITIVAKSSGVAVDRLILVNGAKGPSEQH